MPPSTEPRVIESVRPQITCIDNAVKFGHVVFEICELTDRQTNKQTNGHTDTLFAILGGEVMNVSWHFCSK